MLDYYYIDLYFDPDRTPSARVLQEMDKENETFFEFARRLADQHRVRLKRRPLEPATYQFLEETADESRRRQAAIEAQDDETFEAYLARYFGQVLSTRPGHGTSEAANGD